MVMLVIVIKAIIISLLFVYQSLFIRTRTNYVTSDGPKTGRVCATALLPTHDDDQLDGFLLQTTLAKAYAYILNCETWTQSCFTKVFPPSTLPPNSGPPRDYSTESLERKLLSVIGVFY